MATCMEITSLLGFEVLEDTSDAWLLEKMIKSEWDENFNRINKGAETGIIKNILTKRLVQGQFASPSRVPVQVARSLLSEEKMQKSNLCTRRVQAGLLPACVRVCPTGALSFESANRVQTGKENRFAATIVNAGHTAAVQK